MPSILKGGPVAGIAGMVISHNKDDRVESIYTKPRCDNASTRGKHSI